jgi:hypothetical protein
MFLTEIVLWDNCWLQNVQILKYTHSKILIVYKIIVLKGKFYWSQSVGSYLFNSIWDEYFFWDKFFLRGPRGIIIRS